MEGLRRKVLKIADQAWPLFMGVNAIPARVIEGGLPDDARCVGCYHDGRTASIVFESESFPPVHEGAMFPEFTIQLRDMRAEKPADVLTSKDGR